MECVLGVLLGQGTEVVAQRNARHTGSLFPIDIRFGSRLSAQVVLPLKKKRRFVGWAFEGHLVALFENPM